ncbi:MAG: putative endonuclease [Bradyrhizobium sp.]|nr:putative endonuclease [Bradyrhizobium sp.]
MVDRARDFATELGDPATTPAERILALKYVLHFMGDLHQPLHMADNHDHGGNCIAIALGGSRTVNLHGYWDTVVVSELGKDARSILARLNGDITPALATLWSRGDFASWGKESSAVAVSVAYSFSTPPRCESHMAPLTLPSWYDARAQAPVATQLERAGVRLAIVLEKALGPLSLAEVSASPARPAP